MCDMETVDHGLPIGATFRRLWQLSGPLSFFVSEFMLSIDHDPALLPSPVTAASAN
jgi:hypothetical protein